MTTWAVVSAAALAGGGGWAGPNDWLDGNMCEPGGWLTFTQRHAPIAQETPIQEHGTVAGAPQLGGLHVLDPREPLRACGHADWPKGPPYS